MGVNNVRALKLKLQAIDDSDREVYRDVESKSMYLKVDEDVFYSSTSANIFDGKPDKPVSEDVEIQIID